MAVMSSCNSVGASIVNCSAYHEACKSRSERFSTQRLSSTSPVGMASSRDTETEDLQSRSCSKISALAGVVATSLASISFLSTASFAVTSDLDVSFPTTVSTSTLQDNSLNIAIPIPHLELWVFAQKGFIAPFPRTALGRFNAPFPWTEKGVGSQASQHGCPSWQPSELEMVLPDFQGRPKPFPKMGQHWPAAFILEQSDLETSIHMTLSENWLVSSTQSAKDTEKIPVMEIEALQNVNLESELSETDRKLTLKGLVNLSRTGELMCFSL